MTKLRCAIYTRKSSEEGLDQAFNSLDAQREAGEAYVRSQASEGWRLITTRYDDGGHSGGTMERPALQRLLADIDAGLVDVVVVYKIDRLTRSLADFARIVERFDARGVSFVSVTQAFNTTSSMGRLTLNVLLSFAQFEREVTGERIRDKIAASKAKGMWMGGVPPLGYDLPLPGTRTLQVNEVEAGTVRHIFRRYLELGSVHLLQTELAQASIVSKRRATAQGKLVGGKTLGRGALFYLLSNRLYLGQICHKGVIYDGAHRAIVEAETFELVADKLARGRRRDTKDARKVVEALLTGRIVDATGELMSPTFSYGRSGRVYRYYVSGSLQKGAADPNDGVVRRVSAPDIEAVVQDAVKRLHPRRDFAALKQVRLGCRSIEISLPASVASWARDRLVADETITAEAEGTITIALGIALPLRGGSRKIAFGQGATAAPDPVMVSALRKAHAMLDRSRGFPLMAVAPRSPYERRLLRLAFLAPDIQSAILTGCIPPQLNLETMMRSNIPLSWERQRIMLGLSRREVEPVIS